MKLYELTILEVQTQVTRDSTVPSTLNMLEISHKIKKKKATKLELCFVAQCCRSILLTISYTLIEGVICSHCGGIVFLGSSCSFFWTLFGNDFLPKPSSLLTLY